MLAKIEEMERELSQATRQRSSTRANLDQTVERLQEVEEVEVAVDGVPLLGVG